MFDDKQRLQILIVVAVLAVVALMVTYNAGLSRGQLGVRKELLTAQAELIAQLSATPTVIDTPTETLTPTLTYTPTPSRTPTLTATPTATPASPEEWADRFRVLAEEGLNAISIGELSGDRAESLLRGIAREQGLLYVPATYFELEGVDWAALVVPRTPAGEALPMLFWREPNDRNRIRSQDLLPVLSATGGGTDYSRLLGGVSFGSVRSDFLGKLHVLLVERSDLRPDLRAAVIAQQRPAGDFVPLWDSADDPLWDFVSSGSQLQIMDADGRVLPDIQIMAPLSEGDAIRNVIGAPDGFVERAPFARQWGASLWTFTSVEQAQEAPDGAQPGYALEDAALVSTPLTALARVLSDLQTSDLSDASHHVSRLDLLQEAYDLGLYQPGTWVSAYLDDGGRELDGAEISQRVRFFDNGNRGRSYIAGFDQGADGSYRLASLEVAAPAAEDNRLTPSAPLPTLTFTPVPTDTPVPSPTTPLDPSAQATLDAQPTPTLTFTPTATNTPLPTQTDTPTPTATSLPTQTPTNTPTTTPTFTATPSPTQTSTATPTFTDTPTPTQTATPTATERPYPVPEIPTEQAPLAKGTVVRWPANLRAEPNTGSATIVQLGAAIPVDLFGITEDGTWMLVRVNSPEDERNGEIGWIATDLMEIAGSTAFLTRYRVDGTPVVPPTPTYTPTLGTPTATHTVAPTETPTPTLSPTPRPTPVIAAAEAEPMAEIVAPPPEAGEYLLTIRTDEQEIADVSAIGAVDAEQRDWTVLGGTADIQIWSGLFGAFPPEWVSAPPSLLGPGATLYVQGVPSADNGSVLSAQRVRIAAAPATQRARLVARPELAGSVADGSAVALMGSREEAGVYLLETEGTLRQLWIDEREAAWAGGDPSAGVIISGGNPQIAASEFTWIRGDGLGLQVFAQPYHDLHGVVSDALGGLWWIETPQADMDQWQLWQYDAEQGRIVLRLRASGSVFQNGNSTTGSPLTPILLFAQPQLGEGGQIASVSLIVDTLDGAAQQQYQGVFRAEVKLEPGPESEVVGTPQLLMTPGGYRGPLQISPDGSKLAHFLYDPEHPSLTSGVIRPANTARVLILEGRGANTIRTVYQTENRFEFLAPNLGWQGAEKLVLARSRFAPGDTFGIDPFGIVRVTLPDAERPSDQIQTSSYLFPDQNQLRDFAVCADGLHTLTISSNGSGVLELARWNGVDAPQPLFVLPETMSRSFVCWQAPDELIAAP